MPRFRDANGRYVAAGTVGAQPVAAPRVKPSISFLSQLEASWARHGTATIDKVREDRPHDYLRLMASCLPKQPEPKLDPVDTMTDDEVADELRRVLARLAARGIDPSA